MSSQEAPVLPPVAVTQEITTPVVEPTPAVEPVVVSNDTIPKTEEIKEASTEATTETAAETTTEIATASATAATEEVLVTASREIQKELPAVPAPSKSATNRLSTFLNKAKRSLSGHVDKPTDEKVEPLPTPAVTSPAVETHVEEPATVETAVDSHVDEPAAAAAAVSAAPAAEEEHAEAHVSADKTEKRKSRFLGGIFNRSKSPAKHEEHTALEHESPASAESQPAVPEASVSAVEAEEVAAPAEETPKASPVEEVAVPTASAAVVGSETEEETPVAVKDAAHKEVNVLDQIKRNSFVTKLFGKKKEADKPVVKHEEPHVLESTESTAEEPVSPVLETSATEPKPVEEEAPVKEEEAQAKPPSRPSSPLSRRLTQMLRFPKKEKKDKKDRAVAPLNEESAEPAADVPETVSEAAEAAAVEALAVEAPATATTEASVAETPVVEAGKEEHKEEVSAPLTTAATATTTPPVQAVA
ncbi:hypothetical protein J3Q64DRAFT_1717139 [Phycomyces blakesleeanus]|uniref:Altered inheritance of mitochondria protein 21 n=1 Tax=Phycomyces blakesleeanus TaxID=4837 RepID=A0ABR3BID7_PHYBL